jgi:2-keto-4-pentenoate hydratase/2-oxohepta-3-ene-1,7-dioic acid hydratase in catechol pathway
MVLLERYFLTFAAIIELGLDSSAPIGPVLVSPKALKDPHNLEMKSIHNGNVVQSTNTRYDPLPEV